MTEGRTVMSRNKTFEGLKTLCLGNRERFCLGREIDHLSPNTLKPPLCGEEYFSFAVLVYSTSVRWRLIYLFLLRPLCV